MDENKNLLGPQLSARLTPEHHRIINANFQAWTGKEAPTQKELFDAILTRAAGNFGETAGQLEEAENINDAQAEVITQQAAQIKALNAELQYLNAQNTPAAIPENAVLTDFTPADLYFIDRMIQKVQQKTSAGEITRSVYIRAVMKALYQTGHIYAAATFSDSEIRAKTRELNTAPANG